MGLVKVVLRCCHYAPAGSGPKIGSLPGCVCKVLTYWSVAYTSVARLYDVIVREIHPLVSGLDICYPVVQAYHKGSTMPKVREKSNLLLPFYTLPFFLEEKIREILLILVFARPHEISIKKEK